MDHTDLHALRAQIHQIYAQIDNFQPYSEKLPISDWFAERYGEDDSGDGLEDSSRNATQGGENWLRPEPIPGLKKLKENIKLDLEFLDKVHLYHRVLVGIDIYTVYSLQ